MTTGKNPLTEFIDYQFNLLQDRRRMKFMPPFKLWSETHPETAKEIKRALFWFNLKHHPIRFIISLIQDLLTPSIKTKLKEDEERQNKSLYA